MKEPDCKNCWKKETCGMAEEGKFCPQWQSEEPEAREPDPNDAWERGEEPEW